LSIVNEFKVFIIDNSPFTIHKKISQQISYLTIEISVYEKGMLTHCIFF
jgi:hypothetical protein